MSKEKKVVELNDEELEKVSGGYLVYPEPQKGDLVQVEPFEPIIVPDPIYNKDNGNPVCYTQFLILPTSCSSACPVYATCNNPNKKQSK